ncbi:unnamed protein product [Sphagnum jensenii]|uniref:Uncharacterized protein n=1 Tax=Sphagnum jensenii TaxID=128206 RepID=A0ABP0ZXV3_9BRYO
MQLEGHAVIHPSCNTLKNICACSKMFGNSIQGLGRSHPNQQKEQQLFELPSAEIKLIVHQSSAGDVGLQAYHKPLLYKLCCFWIEYRHLKDLN